MKNEQDAAPPTVSHAARSEGESAPHLDRARAVYRFVDLSDPRKPLHLVMTVGWENHRQVMTSACAASRGAAVGVDPNERRDPVNQALGLDQSAGFRSSRRFAFLDPKP